jgi:long-chain acyl-CoA synthetase
MEAHYFITGASGTLGRRIVRLLLENTHATLALLVYQRGMEQEPADFLRQILQIDSAHRYSDRVQLVQGDITRARLGLSEADYDALCSKVNHVVHGAASTQFNLPLEQARQINVEGTRRMIEFFQRCSNRRHFAFLSTAYVAGRNTGMIYEQPLDNSAGYVNRYEQSKSEAEALVLALPDAASIYRLSTVIGDSASGKVDHFTAPHQALQIMYLGLATMVPGTPDYCVDLIPSDHASKALVDLLSEPRTHGRIYHLTAGRDRSYTLAELLEASYTALAACDPDWARKDYPRTPIVSQQAFDRFLQSAEEAGNLLVHQVLSAMKHFAHQLNYPKEFDRGNTDRALPHFHRQLPHICTYYPAVVKYCVSSRFGRV